MNRDAIHQRLITQNYSALLLDQISCCFIWCNCTGGKVLFVNPTYKVEEFIYQLRNSEAKYIVAFPSLLKETTKVAAAAAANIPISNIFLFGSKVI